MITWVKEKWLKLYGDAFWKNVLYLFSGAALSQALPILIYPFITRVYPEDAIALFFVFSGIGMITQIIVSMQFHLAIVLPDNQKEADRLLTINILIIALITVILYFLLSLLQPLLSNWIENKDLIPFLKWIPLSSFFLGLSNALTYYLNRTNLFKQISWSKVIKTLSYSIMQIVFGVFGYLVTGLIYGLLLGQALSTLYLLIILFAKTNFELKLNRSEIFLYLKKYKDIPFFNTLISTTNTLSQQLPVFLLLRFFGTGPVSWYGVANRVVSTPVSLIGQSVAQVFFRESSILNQQGKSLQQFVKTTTWRMFKMAIVPFVILLVTAPWLYAFLFGEQYREAGYMTQLIIPWIFLGFITLPVGHIFVVLNKQRQMFWINLFTLTVRLASLIAGYWFFDNVYVAVGLFSLSGVIYNLYLLRFFLTISQKSQSY